MRTYQDRMKTYCFALILLLVGLILLVPLMARAGMSTGQIDAMNGRMAETLKEANDLAMKHWGTNVMHSMVLSSTGKIIDIDYVSKAFDINCQPVQKQIDYQVDQFRLQLGKALEERGIEKVRILIDGVAHSTYWLY